MKLQAVTVCINYADFLQCILRNRKHFDRWIIVTVPEDEETIKLCEQHDLEHLRSHVLRPDGKDFHSSFNKSRILNEGLDALDQEGWVVILDSDILLPRLFREQILAMPLESGVLYGMGGRKICPDQHMFEILEWGEPWDCFCERVGGVLGYFNLFDLEHPNNRYPKSRDWAEPDAHDDVLFSETFSPDKVRPLPMTCLHVGRAGINRGERRTPRYDLSVETDVVRGVAFRDLLRQTTAVSSPKVAIIGYYPGMGLSAWAPICDQVLLVDHFLVQHPSGDPMIEASRGALRRAWEKEVAGLTNVERLGIHEESNLRRIPDHSLDVLYLSGEVTPNWLVPALPHWRRKLKRDALVCGDLYGLPDWPDSTHAICQLFGTPDHVLPTGFWWRRLDDSSSVTSIRVSSDSLTSQTASKTAAIEVLPGQGVVVMNLAASSVDRLLITLHSLRKYWFGPVLVYHLGKDDPSLQIICARYEVDCESAGELHAAAEIPDSMLEMEGKLVSPFNHSITITSGMLVLGSIQALFDSAAEFGPGPVALSALAFQHDPRGMVHPVSFASAGAFSNAAPSEKPALLWFDEQPEHWDDAACEAWSSIEAEMLSFLATRIRLDGNSSVAVLVDADGLPDFERNWLTWNFGGNVPVIVVCVGIKQNEIWWANGRPPAHLLEVTLPQSYAGGVVLDALLAHVRTERVIVLPQGAKPLPGAELFVSKEWAGYAAVFHSSLERAPFDGALPRPPTSDPLLVSLNADFARRVAGAAREGGRTDDLETSLNSALMRDSRSWTTFDVARWGWRLD